MHGQGQLVQVKTRMSSELARRVDQFAYAYGFTRASAVVALVALGFTEFDALQERARQTLNGTVIGVGMLRKMLAGIPDESFITDLAAFLQGQKGSVR